MNVHVVSDQKRQKFPRTRQKTPGKREAGTETGTGGRGGGGVLGCNNTPPPCKKKKMLLIFVIFPGGAQIRLHMLIGKKKKKIYKFY